MPHPATQILVWICLSIVVQLLQSSLLPALAGILLFLALRVHAQRLFSLMRRARWILLSLLLIYAFLTPGAAFWTSPYLPSPTHEGMQDGLLQLSRLVCMLAGLSILLTLLPRAQLIGGLYVLAYPARHLGLSRERIAVRLALTLHYAESAMRDTASDWNAAIGSALRTAQAEATHIELHVQALTWLDIILLMAGAALLIGTWL